MSLSAPDLACMAELHSIAEYYGEDIQDIMCLGNVEPVYPMDRFVSLITGADMSLEMVRTAHSLRIDIDELDDLLDAGLACGEAELYAYRLLREVWPTLSTERTVELTKVLYVSGLAQEALRTLVAEWSTRDLGEGLLYAWLLERAKDLREDVEPLIIQLSTALPLAENKHVGRLLELFDEPYLGLCDGDAARLRRLFDDGLYAQLCKASGLSRYATEHMYTIDFDPSAQVLLVSSVVDVDRLWALCQDDRSAAEILLALLPAYDGSPNDAIDTAVELNSH